MSPFGSDEPLPKKLHARARHTGALITGVGGWLLPGLAIVTTRVVLAALPQPSVVVSVIV